MRKLCSLVLIAGMLTGAAFAADADALPKNALRGMHSMHPTHSMNSHSGPKGLSGRGNASTGQTFPAGIDTIVNFTGSFKAPGIYFDGTSRDHWEYSMAGNPPEKGGTTVFNAPVIPVSLDLRNPDGSPRYVRVVDGKVVTCLNPSDGSAPAGCKRLFSDVTPFIKPFVAGPVFRLAQYTSSPVPTQITDAVQRAEFGKRARQDWHTLLAPRVKSKEVMTLVQSSDPNNPVYQFALNDDGSCCLFVLINGAAFDAKLFPPSAPDNTTVIGAAEVSGKISPQDISTFLFPNAYLFDGNICCVLGFHTFDVEAGDEHNGNRTKFYVLNYSSWISPGLFASPTCAVNDPENCFQDVTAHSHEIAETFNDPFVGFDGIHNITPFWQNPAGQCQDILESGDVIEDLPNATFPVTIGDVSYHPQNEALLPWFEFQKVSSAIDNAYSYPNETVLTSLSAPQALDCQ